MFICLLTIYRGLSVILPLIQLFIVGSLKSVIFRVGCHKEMGGVRGGDSPVLLCQKETWSADHPAPPFLYLLYVHLQCPPVFYIYTSLYISNVYKSYLQHMSEQSICPGWWSRNRTSSLRCHCCQGGSGKSRSSDQNREYCKQNADWKTQNYPGKVVVVGF